MKKNKNIGGHEKAGGGAGHVFLSYFDAKTGSKIKSENFKNLILFTGRDAWAKSLGGTADYNAVEIGVGTNSTPAAVGDTTLTAGFYKAFDSITYPASGKVRFDFTIEDGEAVGKMISEWGLRTASGTLISRVVRDTFEKTSDIRIVGYWIIDFNV